VIAECGNIVADRSSLSLRHLSGEGDWRWPCHQHCGYTKQQVRPFLVVSLVGGELLDMVLDADRDVAEKIPDVDNRACGRNQRSKSSVAGSILS